MAGIHAPQGLQLNKDGSMSSGFVFGTIGPSRHRRTIPDSSSLWQCRWMPKAYRTDVVGHQKFQGELGKSRTSKSERVRCPVGDCACNYEMYGSQASTRDRDITTLQERL